MASWHNRYSGCHTHTHTPLGEILATALPGLLRHGKPLPETRTCWAWRLTETGRTAAPKLRRNSRSAQMAELLTASDQTEDALNTPDESLARSCYTT